MNFYKRLRELENERERIDIFMYDPAMKIAEALGIPSYYQYESVETLGFDEIEIKLEDCRDSSDYRFIAVPSRVFEDDKFLEEYIEEQKAAQEKAAAKEEQELKRLEIARLERRLKELKES